MQLDETKLLDSITKDPMSVWRIFVCDTNGNERGDGNENGIVVKLFNLLNGWLSKTPLRWGSKSTPAETVVRQSSLLELQHEEIERRIGQLNERLERYARTLRSRFITAERV